MNLKIHPEAYSILKLPTEASLPNWMNWKTFCSITRTSDELSLVVEESSVPAELRPELRWRMIQVEGPLDFSLTGILSSIADPLSRAKISLFAISTFDTDYVLVPAESLPAARSALEVAGFKFIA